MGRSFRWDWKLMWPCLTWRFRMTRWTLAKWNVGSVKSSPYSCTTSSRSSVSGTPSRLRKSSERSVTLPEFMLSLSSTAGLFLIFGNVSPVKKFFFKLHYCYPLRWGKLTSFVSFFFFSYNFRLKNMSQCIYEENRKIKIKPSRVTLRSCPPRGFWCPDRESTSKSSSCPQRR